MTPDLSDTRLAEVKPYQPASGMDGALFMEQFCDRCQLDAAFRSGTGDSCPIAANTMVFSPGDEGYPPEWIYDADDEPVCTAFVSELQANRGAEG